MRDERPGCRPNEDDIIDVVTVAGCGVLEVTEVVLETVCRAPGLMGNKVEGYCDDGLVSCCAWKRGN